MEMRLRIPELLAEKETNAYRVARDSGGRISMSTIYRLKKARGRLDMFSNDVCQALCDVLKVTPGELFESDKSKRR